MSYQVGPQQTDVITPAPPSMPSCGIGNRRGCDGSYMDSYPLLDGDGKPVAYVLDEGLGNLMAWADELRHFATGVMKAS